VLLQTEGGVSVPAKAGIGFMVAVMALEVAVDAVAQEPLPVSTHITTSPLVNVVLLKAFEFVPTLLPFTFH
jgi:hypothetical protein